MCTLNPLVHLSYRNSYIRLLFVYYRLAFSTFGFIGVDLIIMSIMMRSPTGENLSSGDPRLTLISDSLVKISTSDFYMMQECLV